MSANIDYHYKSERKIIRVSPKRQITIPIQFYEELRLDKEVECYMEGNKLVIRPLYQEAGEFSLEILKDLVGQGLSGDELVREYELQSKNIKEAITNLLEEADEIASGKKKAASFQDVFGEDD